MANFLHAQPPKITQFNKEDFYYLYNRKGGKPSSHTANSATGTTSRPELARYYHQCLGSPPKSAILRALRNHPNELQSFPGLTRQLISRYLPLSTATYKGHMVRVRQGLNSTKSNKRELIDARNEVDDMAPPQQMCTAIDNEMFCFTILEDEGGYTVYSDQTGRFPIESYKGMNYVFVLYDYKLNAILLRPLKSRKDEDMVAAFQSAYEELKKKGHNPTLHVLDNECSRAVRTFI